MIPTHSSKPPREDRLTPTSGGSEANEVNTRLLQCALAIEESRAFWSHAGSDGPAPSPQRAFEECWFGAKSLTGRKSRLKSW